jgi:hypothetical protein
MCNALLFSLRQLFCGARFHPLSLYIYSIVVNRVANKGTGNSEDVCGGSLHRSQNIGTIPVDLIDSSFELFYRHTWWVLLEVVNSW